MFVPSDSAYEEVRRTQRELRERAVRAQELARLRRERALARQPQPGRISRAARRMRAALARP